MDGAKARATAGDVDRSGLIDAELALVEAQIAVDAARARALRAAPAWYDAVGTDGQDRSVPCRAGTG